MQRYKRHLIDTYGTQKQTMRVWSDGVEIGSRRVDVPAQCPIGSCTDGKFDGSWYEPTHRHNHTRGLDDAATARYARQQGGSYTLCLDHQEALAMCEYVRYRFKPLP